jgi:hypothetical protein
VFASIKQIHTRDKRKKIALFTRNGAVTSGRGYTKVFKGDCGSREQKHQSEKCGEKLANKRQ